MKTYAIDDARGNQLTTGLSGHNAAAVAQQMANDRGESVFLYEIAENGEATEAIEVRPEE